MAKHLIHLFKIFYHYNKRKIQDLFVYKKRIKKFKTNSEQLFSHSVTLSLPILQTETFENKLHNLTTAIDCIQGVCLHQNEILSFWKQIGYPSAKKGYKEGRVISNNELKLDIAGGLCQLSGIIYYVSIQSKLNILERHNHSKDIYNDSTRFTPLGTDASVVYPTKDLRVQNPFPFPIQFYFDLTNTSLRVNIRSKEKLPTCSLLFSIENKNGFSKITVKEKNEESDFQKIISIDHYKI
ncbi:VanW family protein [Leptospira sp. 96542]|nr:VanW family protein [Leptospira sp. 96542]